jgi:hypothetical protein
MQCIELQIKFAISLLRSIVFARNMCERESLKPHSDNSLSLSYKEECKFIPFRSRLKSESETQLCCFKASERKLLLTNKEAI